MDCTKRFARGPNYDLSVGSTEENYLKLLLIEEMCEHIRVNINNYAEFSKEVLKDMYDPTGKKEMEMEPNKRKSRTVEVFHNYSYYGNLKTTEDKRLLVFRFHIRQ